MNRIKSFIGKTCLKREELTRRAEGLGIVPNWGLSLTKAA